MHPDFTDSEDPEDPDEEEPSAEELAEIRCATPADAAGVDALILSNCTQHWRKVAMVMGTSLDEFEARFPGLPFIYLQLRIQDLARRGLLEAQGNVMSIRFSEIRLPQAAISTPGSGAAP
jgi:Protein of unknown function